MDAACNDSIAGDRRKKFSLKRWVKKAWAKQRRSTEEKQLKRMQRKEAKKAHQPEDGAAEAGLVERFNRLPTVLDNNAVSESMDVTSWPTEPRGNQDEETAPIPPRKESVAPFRIGVPYTDSITIENPILNNSDNKHGATNGQPAPTDNPARTKKSCERFRRPNNNSGAAMPSRQDLFSQINKLPHDPRDFLRDIQLKQRKPHNSNHASTRIRALDPQFTGPIAAVLARAAVINADNSSSSSDEGSSDDEWK